WSGKTRNWQPAGAVWLNPERETGAPEIRDAARNRRTTCLTNTVRVASVQLGDSRWFQRQLALLESGSRHLSNVPMLLNIAKRRLQ
ncbi:MAG: hypothetical protein ACI8R4_003575, partial [Paracoccaceae bacterium]